MEILSPKVPEDLHGLIASFLTFSELKPFLGNGFLARLGIIVNKMYLYKSDWMYVPCRILSTHYDHGTGALRVTLVVQESWEHRHRGRTETVLSPAHFHQLFLLLNAKVYPHIVSISDEVNMVVHMGRAFYDSPCLALNLLLDVMDPFGVWYEGVVVSFLPDKVLIHFQGWDTAWTPGSLRTPNAWPRIAPLLDHGVPC